MSQDVLKALLNDLKQDDYVRFRFGKRLDAALKSLESAPAPDTAEIEKRLTELLKLVRGEKGGAASASSKRPSKPKAASHANA